ncbi:hypothetical protein AB6A40_006767 [Gnathostoma spinigerum]|uniref:Carboxylic ester hydrolase n=1 Tax=Gnathostoma spinigerum TaxID=75299 RepID=A0ABD6EJI4_9BILA
MKSSLLMRNHRLQLCIWLVILITTAVTFRECEVPLKVAAVKTKLGKVRGVRKVLDVWMKQFCVSAYLGVPFAQAPIGALRFASPLPAEPWKGTFNASTPAKSCYGSLDTTFGNFAGATMWNPKNEMSEDCLTLNMWVPSNPSGEVIVWVFGGGFYSGSPSLDLYEGSVLAALHGVIVVNINYRLGPFGFLYLGDQSHAKGNIGLLDQQMALRWINQNIASFGGDPRKVTLMGESAGSASVIAHLFAPGSHRYFKNIIAQSGTVLNSWAFRPVEEVLQTSVRFLKVVGCMQAKQNLDESFRCLLKKTPMAIQMAADKMGSSVLIPPISSFSPIDVDSVFFMVIALND